MAFGFGRSDGFPTQYAENRTAVTVDILETGLVVAFILLYLSFWFILPGGSIKTQFYLFTRITTSLAIGVILLLSNYGQEWEVGVLRTKTAYRAGTAKEIHADIAIKLGLRSMNITLQDLNQNLTNPKAERIDYNERFSWEWDQGRIGFGPAAGHLQQAFREGQRTGLPLPILWIVDYFVVDGEGLRYGRFYRTAGWYTHIIIWLTFPVWLLSNFMFLSVIRYGAFLLAILGFLKLSANLVWSVVRNPYPLIIPFEDGDITMHYGVNFWLNFISGIVCIFLGAIILLMDLRCPDDVAIFFGLDPLSDYEEIQLTKNELDVATLKTEPMDANTIEMDASEEYADIAPEATVSVLKRRSTLTIAQKSLFRSHATIEEEQIDYADTLDVQLPILHPKSSAIQPPAQMSGTETKVRKPRRHRR